MTTAGDETEPTLPLGPGAEGAPVLDLQRRLDALGHLEGPTDGHYATRTRDAVLAFQAARGLRVDGVCGRQTWAALVEAGYRLGDRLLYLRAPMLRGDDVGDLQRQLCALGFDAGRVDGIFGPDTERALKDFQRNAAITTDGVCGRDTLVVLRRLGDRTGGGATVAEIRQAEELRTGAAGTLADQIIAVGERGPLPALATAVARHLRARDARPLTLHHPDEHVHARRANDGGALAYLGLDTAADIGTHLAYFAVPGFTSVGGRHLAERLGAELGTTWAPVRIEGMRLPVLRETRMPAVLCTVGPTAAVVAGLDELAATLSRAIEAWHRTPVAPPAQG